MRRFVVELVLAILVLLFSGGGASPSAKATMLWIQHHSSYNIVASVPRWSRSALLRIQPLSLSWIPKSRKFKRDVTTTTRSTSSSITPALSSSSSSSLRMAVLTPPIVPRAAVSVVVQCQGIRATERHNDDDANINTHYLLIQRGKEPNQGMWSLPGGSIEYGETALAGGQRELAEETLWMPDPPGSNKCAATAVVPHLHWYNGTVTTSDAIGEGYHYLIAHCFAQVVSVVVPPQDTPSILLPTVLPADDAADAQWFTYDEICELEGNHGENVTTARITTGTRHNNDNQKRATTTTITPGVARVLQLIQSLAGAGLLPTTPSSML